MVRVDMVSIGVRVRVRILVWVRGMSGRGNVQGECPTLVYRTVQSNCGPRECSVC